MASQPARRIFLVGCPRSGTTLLQSLLASHSKVISFPESHFFAHLRPGRRWARKTGLISSQAAPRFDAFVERVGWPRRVRPRLPFVRLYVRAFIRLLDNMALREGKSSWIEKSPHHLRYIDHIESLVADPVFIHIVRSGADVVASLYAATHGPWKGFAKPMSLDQCITRWSTDVELTRRQLGKPNHILVRYETLVSDSAAALKRICAFLGLQYEERMLQGHQAAAQQVILPWEHWKTGVLDPIRNANATKLFDVLDHEQAQYVLSKTASIDIPAEI